MATAHRQRNGRQIYTARHGRPAIERAGDLASIFATESSSTADGDILFIDEIHRPGSDGRGGVVQRHGRFQTRYRHRQGPAARSIRLDLPKFTVIGATTRTEAWPLPLRDRFGHMYRL